MAPFHDLAPFYEVLLVMGVERGQFLVMTQYDDVSIAPDLGTGIKDLSAGSGVYRHACIGSDVDPMVVLTPAWAELRGDHACFKRPLPTALVLWDGEGLGSASFRWRLAPFDHRGTPLKDTSRIEDIEDVSLIERAFVVILPEDLGQASITVPSAKDLASGRGMPKSLAADHLSGRTP